MRILVLHSRYASGHLSGENRVVADEARLLEEAGHEVQVWAPSGEKLRGARALRAGVQAVWSRAAAKAVRDFGPDVVHCHNLFPLLSPAVGETYGVGNALIHSTCMFAGGAAFFSLALLLSAPQFQWR